ncbi:MAG: terminase family protein [Chloroflexi bacterium]|nr:terminase family protein [Chloroflexota bacterium]
MRPQNRIVFSDAQANLATFGSRPGRFVLVSGPRRCGKSDAALAGFMQFAARGFSGVDFALVTKTQAQMDGVMVPKVRAWAGRNGLEVQARDKRLTLPDIHGGANTFWQVIGADGVEAAAKRIQGFGIGGAYVDEFTRVPPTLVEMILTSMLEYASSKFVATCNPEGPEHWAKLDYFDKVDDGTLNGETHKLEMADNPILSAESIAEMAAGLTGPFYRRMILGEWAASSGLVHPVVKYAPLPKDALVHRYEVALDFGRSSVTHAVLVAYHRNSWTVVDEWVHDGRTSGQMAVAEQTERIFAWATAAGSRSVAAWAVPPDAHGLAEGIAGLAGGSVVKAVDNVIWGIQALNSRLESRLTVDPRCEHLRRELAAYRWDERAGARGDDRPDKTSAGGAHGSDALRYWAATAHAAVTGRRP